jgi:hypothetical protein
MPRKRGKSRRLRRDRPHFLRRTLCIAKLLQAQNGRVRAQDLRVSRTGTGDHREMNRDARFRLAVWGWYAGCYWAPPKIRHGKHGLGSTGPLPKPRRQCAAKSVRLAFRVRNTARASALALKLREEKGPR